MYYSLISTGLPKLLSIISDISLPNGPLFANVHLANGPKIPSLATTANIFNEH